MSYFRAGIAVKAGEDVTVLFHPQSDHHTDIRELHHIRDDDGPGATRQTPMEYRPFGALADISSYRLTFDAGVPAWWTADMTESAIRQFRREVERELREGIFRLGDLDLGDATSMGGVAMSAMAIIYKETRIKAADGGRVVRRADSPPSLIARMERGPLGRDGEAT